jgi:hypothetical protein
MATIRQRSGLAIEGTCSMRFPIKQVCKTSEC